MRNETTAQRQLRLQRQRDYNSRRRRAETGDSGHSSTETQAHYARRLERQREYSRRRREAARHGQSGSRTHSASMEGDGDLEQRQHVSTTDHARTLEILDATKLEHIEEELSNALGADGLDEATCAVCDRLVLRKTARYRSLSDSKFLAAIRSLLQPPDEELPSALLSYYDCGDFDPSLEGLLLSRTGIRVGPSNIELCVCFECSSSLSSGIGKLPKFAIANGFFIGALPSDLHEATWIENIMTQLVTVVAQTRIMRGGHHRSIRSHCMVFDATPGPPATLLPRRVDRNGSYHIVLAGPITPAQHNRIRKLHYARGSKVNDLLKFYKSNNHLYEDVNVAWEQEQVDTAVCDRISIEHNDAGVADAIDEEQRAVTGRSDGAEVHEEEECNVVERNILLSEESSVANASFVQRLIDLNANERSSAPRLRLEHSTRFAMGTDIEAKMFPHLFPYGRGHPGEKRRTHVSKRSCMKYYAMLSSRRFAQDSTFLLTAFSRLSLENMYTLTSVKCRRFEAVFKGYETLSLEDLSSALVNNERRQRGEPRLSHVNPDAERFLKSVELGSASVWGSNAERRQCRQNAFGYQTRYGQPSLFVTLTPNTDNSYAMSHYTGNLSVETLFDCLEARVPSAAAMKTAAMMDDCASARLFARIVDTFITHVLGIDPTSQKSLPGGGLFGYTKAYFGMVETQGRGTLHIHFLIWLHGAPVNSEDFEQRVQEEGGAFLGHIEAYTNSIVTTELPLRTSDVKCSRCGEGAVLLPLPIPPSSRRSQCKGHGNDPVSEPPLFKCSLCSREYSAQHILRSSLLLHRPPHWPPPLAPLSDEDVLKQARKERSTRSSGSEAVDIVREREWNLVNLASGASDEIADLALRLTNTSRAGFCYPDDDPYKTDPIHRQIEMMPPMWKRSRMSREHYSYMLSSLVFNMNMHWWSHASSCFKQSRSTSSSSVCRYGFPRERAPSTRMTGPVVVLSRRAGHEYINGYNPVLMATFKCNHDIQVLFGGKEAINRIYYCCKYVTKSQRQIDSSTAVALASFQRRQAREHDELGSNAPPSVADIRRRRVTGLIHTFTSKQEIAGPLAALYVLRGSACYSSSTCVTLRLGDAFQQLESGTDYTCTLVRCNDVAFNSASHLDDYLHRPQILGGLSLYEFTMQCYRKLATSRVSDDHRFNSSHPLAASHCVIYRRCEAVPVIQGPRLPSWSEEMGEEQRELYAKVAMVLFKPFRRLDDLIDASTSWMANYLRWESFRSDFTKTIMQNMQDYHSGRDAENDAFIDEVEEDDQDSDCDVVDFAEPVPWMEQVGDVQMGSELEAMYAFLFNQDGDDLEEGTAPVFPGPPIFPPESQNVLDEVAEFQLIESIARDVAEFVHHDIDLPLSLADLRKWVATASASPTTASVVGDLSMDPLDVPPCIQPTRLTELIDARLQRDEISWMPNGAVAEAAEFCSITELSQAYTLNRLQHIAFALTATHLLQRWRSVVSQEAYSSPSVDAMYERQLRMFMGGEGGTGKSRVIRAIQEFCHRWQRAQSVLVCALTGKAASIVGGRTLASFENTLRSAKSRTFLQDMDCLIVDEVSMMSKQQLVRLDKLLRTAKRVDEVPFGGIHVVLVGDFLQLPPVGADPLFANPAHKLSSSLGDFPGYELWRMFDKVVVLEETVRFRDDPEWGEGCSRARLGDWTPSFIRLINSRVVGSVPDESTPRSSAPSSGSVFVTPDNITRTAINAHFLAATCKHVQTEEYPVRVVANFKGALDNLSASDIDLIMGLPDTMFGRMAPFLDLVPGMPIQITQNVCTEKGVANGTMGVLHSVHFPIGTTFRPVRDARTDAMVRLPDKRPLYALVLLDRGSGAIPIADGLDPGVFPVFPESEAYAKANVTLTPARDGSPRKLSVRIQQFPFVCAVGATAYKVQGESLQSMAVVDWKVGHSGANRPQQVYLIVSRVVARSAFLALHPLTPEIVAWAKPPKAAVDEDKRLQAESRVTVQRFNEGQNT